MKRRTCSNPNNNPKCKIEIYYSNEYSYRHAEKNKSVCKSCSSYGENNPYHWKGKRRSKDTIDKIKKSKIGQKSNYDIWLEKYGKEEADERQRISNEKNSKSNTGRKQSEESKRRIGKSNSGSNPNKRKPKPWQVGENNPSKRPEVKEKIRIARLKEIEEKHGQVMPNYNPVACEIIEGFNKFGYNFRHAENGGEVCVAGYFPDGLDEERNLIVEMDESHHFDVDGNLRQKDVERQKYLEKLGYTIIRIKI